ncbi:MAG: putative toxin-antitoxin system toxin component, PIN family, partial [Pseudomonadota bacterium]
MRIVVDTNIYVAALATRGLCHVLVEAMLTDHEIITASEILKELEEVISRKLKIPVTTRKEIISFWQKQAIIVHPVTIDSSACRDPDDLMILGTALAAQADCIVTGDDDLLAIKLYEGIPILSP